MVPQTGEDGKFENGCVGSTVLSIESATYGNDSYLSALFLKKGKIRCRREGR